MWVNAPTPHDASKAYALMPVRDDDKEEHIRDEEARYGKPKQGFCPHFNGDYTVYNLPNMRSCWASKAMYNAALPTFFNINLFRCSNFSELRGLLRILEHKDVHPIRRIEVIWQGSTKKDTIDRLSIVVLNLKKLGLIFDERTKKATLDSSTWKLLLRIVREKQWQVDLHGEAEWLDTGRQQLEASREMARGGSGNADRDGSDGEGRSASWTEGFDRMGCD